MILHRSRRLPLLLLSFALLPCLAPHAARAQMSFGRSGAPTSGGPPGGADSGASGEDPEAKAAAAAAAPPPALPGAVPSDPDAPASHAALDMNPNAALFDAINRGDLSAAKDALSRGADLQSTNILGEKPIEMAIDLNRNDITFLLLSMRNREESGSDMQVASGTVTSSTGTVSHVGARGRREPGGTAVAQASLRPREGENGGTPQPDIGFLGFNGS